MVSLHHQKAFQSSSFYYVWKKCVANDFKITSTRNKYLVISIKKIIINLESLNFKEFGGKYME